MTIIANLSNNLYNNQPKYKHFLKCGVWTKRNFTYMNSFKKYMDKFIQDYENLYKLNKELKENLKKVNKTQKTTFKFSKSLNTKSKAKLIKKCEHLYLENTRLRQRLDELEKKLEEKLVSLDK
jgi:seryl-tRNA synthetase